MRAHNLPGGKPMTVNRQSYFVAPRLLSSYRGLAVITLATVVGGCARSGPKGKQKSDTSSESSLLPGSDERLSDDAIGMIVVNGSELPKNFKSLGLFGSQNVSHPMPSLVPYAVKVSLWSDGLDKERFIFVPAATKITIDKNTKKLVFPIGTILIKHFAEGSNPVETRVLVHASDDTWKMATYQWGPDDDAIRVDKPKFTKVSAPDKKGNRLQSPNECKLCHSNGNSIVLGFQPDQLNGAAFGATITPIQTIANTPGAAARLFAPDVLEAIKAAPTRLDPYDTGLSISLRARAYMDLNCATCHNPKSSENFLDFSLATGLTSDYPSALLADQRVVPGDLDKSVIWKKYVDPLYRMPPVSVMEDPLGRQLLHDWLSAWPLPVTTNVISPDTVKGNEPVAASASAGTDSKTGNGAGT